MSQDFLGFLPGDWWLKGFRKCNWGDPTPVGMVENLIEMKFVDQPYLCLSLLVFLDCLFLFQAVWHVFGRRAKEVLFYVGFSSSGLLSFLDRITSQSCSPIRSRKLVHVFLLGGQEKQIYRYTIVLIDKGAFQSTLAPHLPKLLFKAVAPSRWLFSYIYTVYRRNN